MFLAVLAASAFSVFSKQDKDWGPPPPVAPYGHDPLPGERVVIPMIFPVLGQSRWDDGYGKSRGAFLHTGIDIRAPKMTPVVAPFSGTLGMKRETFWIYGDNGWSMLGTHLNDDDIGRHNHDGSRDVMFAPNVAPFQHVVAGQFIGFVGESGDATAPHLHFEIYAPGEGLAKYRIRNPFPSLKAAKRISAPVPVIPNPANHPPAGQLRLQACVRLADPNRKLLSVILSAMQYPSGKVVPSMSIHFIRFKLSDPIIQSVGGWPILAKLPEAQSIAIYVRTTTSLENSKIERIVIDPLAAN